MTEQEINLGQLKEIANQYLSHEDRNIRNMAIVISEIKFEYPSKSSFIENLQEIGENRMIIIKTNTGNIISTTQTLVGDYIEYEDVHGIWWKLTPTTNENIKFPFVIESLNKEKK